MEVALATADPIVGRFQDEMRRREGKDGKEKKRKEKRSCILHVATSPKGCC